LAEIFKKMFVACCKPLTRYGPLSGEKRNQENRLSLLGDAGCGSLGNINNYIVNFIKNSRELPAVSTFICSINSNSMDTCFDRLFSHRQASKLHKK